MFELCSWDVPFLYIKTYTYFYIIKVEHDKDAHISKHIYQQERLMRRLWAKILDIHWILKYWKVN